MRYELRELSFGEVLGEGFSLYFDNFLALFGISLLSIFPAIFFSYNIAANAIYAGSRDGQVGGAIVFLLLYGTASTLATALTIELISKKYLKQPHTLGQYLRNVLPFIFPIIGLALMQILIIGIPAGLLIAISPMLILLVFFPAVYLFIGFLLSSQVLIVEGKGVLESLKRSLELTKGKKLEIFGFLFILGILNYGLQQVIIHVIAPLILRSFSSIDTRLMVYFGFYYLFQILLNGITSCVFVLVYFNRRILLDGFHLEHLVDQFDAAAPLSEVSE